MPWTLVLKIIRTARLRPGVAAREGDGDGDGAGGSLPRGRGEKNSTSSRFFLSVPRATTSATARFGLWARSLELHCELLTTSRAPGSALRANAVDGSPLCSWIGGCCESLGAVAVSTHPVGQLSEPAAINSRPHPHGYTHARVW